jgi:predicted CopG family antitoxin
MKKTMSYIGVTVPITDDMYTKILRLKGFVSFKQKTVPNASVKEILKVLERDRAEAETYPKTGWSMEYIQRLDECISYLQKF